MTTLSAVQDIPLLAIDFATGATGNDRTVYEGIDALAAIIRREGFIGAIVVRPRPAGRYQVVAGHRRYKAVESLGWETIPCMVKDLTDEQVRRIMLQENEARINLNEVDRAHAYARLMDQDGLTVADVARVAGQKTDYVARRLCLLTLTPAIQQLVQSGNLGIAYAGAMAALDANFQARALQCLQANPAPTVRWFTGVCSDLLASQAQAAFDADIFNVDYTPDPVLVLAPDPPLPGKDTPPCDGPPAVALRCQVAYWQAAAGAWEQIGKYGQRDRCLAAVAISENVLAMLSAATPVLGDEPAPYTVLDATRFLHVSEASVKNYVKSGRLAARLDGRNGWRFTRSALDACAALPPPKPGRPAVVLAPASDRSPYCVIKELPRENYL